MPNQSGSLYGLTILSPILNDENATPSHDLQIRLYLASLYTDERGPFAIAPLTHLTRLVVMDDVIYVGAPSCEEHTKFKYLVWESNFDGDLDTYLTTLAKTVPTEIDAIWSHCVGYPGTRDIAAFICYMKACQLETTFYFAAINNKTVEQALTAIQTQKAVSDFVACHQGMEPAQLQQEFLQFVAKLRTQPVPQRGSAALARDIKTGGHNE